MGSIWRLNPEVKKEAWEYASHGTVIDDVFGAASDDGFTKTRWPSRMSTANFVGYFTPPGVLGMQPRGPVLDDLRHRYELAPRRFTHYHPFWGHLLAMEPHAPGVPTVPVLAPPTTPGVTTPAPPPVAVAAAVPEPASIILLAAAALAVAAGLVVGRGHDDRTR
jgi:hypothetical protein